MNDFLQKMNYVQSRMRNGLTANRTADVEINRWHEKETRLEGLARNTVVLFHFSYVLLTCFWGKGTL